MTGRRGRSDYQTRPPRWRWWLCRYGTWSDIVFGGIAFDIDRPIRLASDYGHIGRNEFEWRMIRGDRRDLPAECYRRWST